MNKAHLIQIIFVVVEIFAAIPLTIEVFGDMDPGVITVSAVVLWVGMIGSMVCALVRAAQAKKK